MEKDKISETYLTIEELLTIYHLLEYQYISYENTEAINLVRKIRDIINDIHKR